MTALGCLDTCRPDGDGWHPLSNIYDEHWLARHLARLSAGNGHGPRPRAVAGAYLAGGLSWAVAAPVTAVLVTEHRALCLPPEGAAIHVDDDGHPTRLAIHEPRYVDGTVADVTEAVADELSAIFARLFSALRRTCSLGTPGMWGMLADNIAETLWLLPRHGATPHDLDAAWTLVEALLDGIQARQPRLRIRPRRFALATSTPPIALPMRGTCCLCYRTPEAAADEDGMCTTCPRRGDDECVELVETRRREQHQALTDHE